jgi:hypothetical protein
MPTSFAMPSREPGFRFLVRARPKRRANNPAVSL